MITPTKAWHRRGLLRDSLRMQAGMKNDVWTGNVTEGGWVCVCACVRKRVMCVFGLLNKALSGMSGERRVFVLCVSAAVLWESELQDPCKVCVCVCDLRSYQAVISHARVWEGKGQYSSGKHRDKGVMLKRFISTTQILFSVLKSVFPKKYKIKQVHQRIRNHINENEDTMCCFFYINPSIFFIYLYILT